MSLPHARTAAKITKFAVAGVSSVAAGTIASTVTATILDSIDDEYIRDVSMGIEHPKEWFK